MSVDIYAQPGVVVEEGLGYTPASVASGDVVTAIVGSANGTISGLRYALLESAAYEVPDTGVSAESITVSSRINGSLFVEDTDYVVASGTSVTVQRKMTEIAATVTDVVVPEVFTLANNVAVNLAHQNIVGAVTVMNGVTPVTTFTVDEIEGTVTLTSGGPIVGAAITYSYTPAVAVEISASPTAVVTNAYVEDGSVVVTDLDETEATIFVEGSDYTIDYDAGTISLVAGGQLSTGDLVYVSFDKCKIKSGENVRISYVYTPTGYYEPTTLYSYSSVVEMYGAPFDSNGAIQSELSLAAYHAFGNGASVIVCVATTTSGSSDVAAGVMKLNAVEGIDIVLPLSGNATVHDQAVAEVVSASLAGYERTALLGFDGADAPLTVDSMAATAERLNTNRAVVVAPSSIRMRNFVTNAEMDVDGYFLAAAVAGVIARGGRQVPTTMKVVNGFSSFSTVYNRQDIETMMKRGLCLVGLKNGSMKVLHGRTSTSESAEKQEISVSMNHDFIARSVRTMLMNGFIGSQINATTTTAISTATASALTNLTARGFLYSFSGVSAVRNVETPTTVDVRFSYKPAYALNHIVVTITVDTTTA